MFHGRIHFFESLFWTREYSPNSASKSHQSGLIRLPFRCRGEFDGLPNEDAKKAIADALEASAGTRINMETDVIGKYVRHMVAPHLGLASEEAKAGKLSVEFLRENGFF